MLYQPTNITPSSFAGVGGDLIDATEDMTISWQVNGTSAMTGYQIVICQNDSASTQLYDTGEVTLSEPFYGVDGDGETQIFSMTITAAALATAGIANGYAAGYKYKITQWWSASDYVEQSAENFFIAQAEPSIVLGTYDSGVYSTLSFTSPTTPLTGAWSQTDGVGMDWVRWRVYVYGNAANPTGGGLVMDSGNIHTQILDYASAGWLNGTSYYVVLDFQLQNGYTGTVTQVAEAAWTDGISLRSTAKVGMSSDCAGALISYPIPTYGQLVSGSGYSINPNGTMTIQSTATGSLTLNDSVTATDSDTITINGVEVTFASISINGIQLSGTSGSSSGGSSIGVTYAGAVYTGLAHSVSPVWCGIVAGTVGINLQNPAELDSLAVTMTDAGLISWVYGSETGHYDLGRPLTGKIVTLIANCAMNSRNAMDTVGGTWYVSALDINTGTLDQWSFDSGIGELFFAPDYGDSAFGITGEQTCYYFGLANNYVKSDLRDELLTAGGAQPTFDGNWLFLSDFGRDGAEDIGAFAAALTGDLNTIDVYRAASGESIMRRVLSIDVTTQTSPQFYGSLIDYNVVNGATYTYNIFYNADDDGDTVSGSVVSGTLTPCWWDWIVLTTTPDADDGTNHMTGVYRFGMNVETGAMSNNNAPSMLQNFTRYPTRQGVSANYRNGSLTAYIGTVDRENNVYIDTAAQAQAILDISTDTGVKFLKTRKGEVWMVDTAGATTVQVGDKYREQPYTATLNWAETGEASEASVISVPTDDAWPEESSFSNVVVLLSRIAVTTPPAQTLFNTAQNVDYSGIVVTGYYSDGTTADVTSRCAFSPANGSVISTAGTATVTVSCTEGFVTRTTTFDLTITAAVLLDYITITAQPNKTSFARYEVMDYTGLIITATYTDGTTADVTAACTFSPAEGEYFTTAGSRTVTATYTYGTLTRTASFSVTVTSALVSVSWSAATDAQIGAVVSALDAGVISTNDTGWSVGDERTVTLAAMAATGVGESHVQQTATLVIMDTGRFTLANATAAGRTTDHFVVGLKNCLREVGYMNPTATTDGGWNACARRTWCNTVFRSAVPAALRGSFKPFINTADDVRSTDYFSLFTWQETNHYSSSTRMAYYDARSKLQKTLGDSGTYSEYMYWWLRDKSMISGETETDFATYRDGLRSGADANGFGGISPFGCI